MKAIQLKKDIREQLHEGKSKQDTYNDLLAARVSTPTELADFVRHEASMSARHKNRVLMISLVAMLMLFILLRLVAFLGIYLMASNLQIFFWALWTGIYIYATYGISNFRGKHFNWLFVALGASTLGVILQTIAGMGTLVLIDWAFLVVLASLAIILKKRLFPDYMIEHERYINQDGKQRARRVIRFSTE